MKLISWNVNGLRAVVGKGFCDIFRELDADVVSLQETKIQAGQIDLEFPGYQAIYNYAERKGYSGTAVFSREEVLSHTTGIGIPEHDTEGRVITVEFEHFYLVNVYTPNSQGELARLPYRLEWEAAFADYLLKLDAIKPVVVCGDLNVAHNEIDLSNPKANRQNAGFSDEERAAFSALLERGFVDTFRHLHPDTAKAYSWWSYRFNSRAKNIGWRIDYFLISERLLPALQRAEILPDILGSDHCPVLLDLNF